MTDQEEFWKKSFGDEYIKRNDSKEIVDYNFNFFSKVLKNCKNVRSIIEFGSNIGLNLIALKKILPNCKFQAVEINKKAAEKLKNLNIANVDNCSINEFEIKTQYDFSFTKGVLIHINPDQLENTYKKIYESSKKYILLVEYFNDIPVVINYRGHQERLFKRDFAGDMLDLYSDLSIKNYGFVYKRDHICSLDNFNWFLLEKINSQKKISS